ncbi:MAG: Secretion system C-terminal sorting domain, partial [Bacteroidota bacterium]
VEDYSPGHIVEGGLDNFKVTGTIILKDGDEFSNPTLTAYPNPSHGSVQIKTGRMNDGPVTVRLCDLTGRTLQSVETRTVSGTVTVRADFPAGLYLAVLTFSDGSQRSVRFSVN